MAGVALNFCPFFEGACPSCRAPMWATNFKNETVFVNNTLSKTKAQASQEGYSP